MSYCTIYNRHYPDPGPCPYCPSTNSLFLRWNGLSDGTILPLGEGEAWVTVKGITSTEKEYIANEPLL